MRKAKRNADMFGPEMGLETLFFLAEQTVPLSKFARSMCLSSIFPLFGFGCDYSEPASAAGEPSAPAVK
jgi:hypothetical protein